MSTPLIIQKKSNLNLEIQGSIGEFFIKPNENEDTASIRVKYIQTHVNFDWSTQDERLLENMIPVREMFEMNELKFDELMQRNIDDSRVSNSLIPYLLRIGSGEAVRFFPPIVTVVLPISNAKRPADYYPRVETNREPYEQYYKVKLTSGKDQEQTFEFEQVEADGNILENDNARLNLNTNKCRLVIVDGQHRAMALLALYRNIKGWPDNAAAYKNYYKRWDKEGLLNFNLKGISLPMVVCVFPELCDNGKFDMKVTQACRSIFLALNKNARPVSTARNILLDDNDIIACFLRETLEMVKAKSVQSPKAMRLWNFELDADVDKRVLTSTVAFSGVMHLYLLLETLMLNSQEVIGVKADPKKYGKIKTLDQCLRRLDGYNLLGDDSTRNVTRYLIPKDALKELIDSFKERYGILIVKGLENFYPYEAMAKAALKLETQIRTGLDLQCHAMLFEGQGVYQVFQTYVEEFETELKESYPDENYPAELNTILEELHGTQQRLQGYEARFSKERCEELFSNVSKLKKVPIVLNIIDELYKTVFTTSAFQTALFATFFFIVEKYNNDTDRDGILKGDENDKKLFNNYIQSLNNFFNPTNDRTAKKIVSVFIGNLSEQEKEFKLLRNTYCLRKIIIPGELNPSEWTKFRYLLLEIWHLNCKNDDALIKILLENINSARTSVFRSFVRREISNYLKNNAALPELEKDDCNRIIQDCLEKYTAALKELGVNLYKNDKIELRTSAKLFFENDDSDE